jgi:Co/Zn/Cd efflux system component
VFDEGRREKQIVALSSVAAAILLTSLKLVVGITTGSLAILSEAAHSGLDLLAAIITIFVVRDSVRPPFSRVLLAVASASFALLMVSASWYMTKRWRVG